MSWAANFVVSLQNTFNSHDKIVFLHRVKIAAITTTTTSKTDVKLNHNE